MMDAIALWIGRLVMCGGAIVLLVALASIGIDQLHRDAAFIGAFSAFVLQRKNKKGTS